MLNADLAVPADAALILEPVPNGSGRHWFSWSLMGHTSRCYSHNAAWHKSRTRRSNRRANQRGHSYGEHTYSSRRERRNLVVARSFLHELDAGGEAKFRVDACEMGMYGSNGEEKPCRDIFGI